MRPSVSYRQAAKTGTGNRKCCVVSKTDRHKTQYQIRIFPPPEVLMKEEEDYKQRPNDTFSHDWLLWLFPNGVKVSLRGNIKSIVGNDWRTVNRCSHIYGFYFWFIFSVIDNEQVSIFITEQNFPISH